MTFLILTLFICRPTCFFYIIIFFILLPLAFLLCFCFVENLLCNSAFEQDQLDPWRYRDTFIIIIIITPGSFVLWLLCYPECHWFSSYIFMCACVHVQHVVDLSVLHSPLFDV